MSTQRPEVTGDGDCFTAAVKLLGDLRGGGFRRVLLCHGLPVGSGGDVEGLRHWHAWVEVLTSDHGWQVGDFSNGKQMMVDKRLYYRAAKLTNRHVWRYTPEDAVREIDADGTAGPWVPGWRELCEI